EVEQGVAFGFRQPTPYPVGLAHLQRVAAALLQDRAGSADLFGLVLPGCPRRRALALGLTERLVVESAARGTQLPVPDLGDRRWGSPVERLGRRPRGCPGALDD